ncbi:protodermal factor 1 [Dendrobium catenatum]|uniref:Protodermal factor 1 n=1 Tax=Dendrobium catenatum TaxID=906689 RepID=A0A2I0VHD7_9ASPA|nr:protodermal factor 1 [Dendrobium catenatum]PKU62821.1 Protodermal factor 1 [Dendrobium catenatum]
MERKKMMISLLLWVLSATHFCLVTSRNLAEVEEQKNNYGNDPHAWSSPSHSHDSPLCQTPPSSGTTPSHGGGIHYSPPTTPSHGGGIHYSPPTTPSHGGSGGGGGGGGGCNCNTPPYITPTPSLPENPPSPTTPISQTPPTPLVPLTPPSPTNPSPLIPDPNHPPFSCNYWFTHPTAIWVLFGYWGTIGQVFGTSPAAGILFGRNLSVLEALGNTREDGYGALLREGTASLLNSMASKNFNFNTQQVREAFNTAIQSEKMAAEQGKIFQKANEGHLKH